MGILTSANISTITDLLFKNRDKPDSPLAVDDVADTLAVPVTLFSATTANLSDATHAINTTDKFAGKLVMNTTTNILQQAQGGDATDTWQPVTGAAAVTPS